MADTKITALTALTGADPANDVIPIVDVSDTTMAASGTTKKISVNNILGAGGTATLASATITGDLTVDTSTLVVESSTNRVRIAKSTAANYPLDVAGRISYSGAIGEGADTTLSSAGTSLLFGNSATWAQQIFYIAGSEAMRLNSTGLGIGVTPSAGKFEVQESGTGAGIGGIFASTASGGGNPGVVFRTASTNRWSLSLTGSAGAESIRFYDINNSATRMTLDASGRLFVGLTSSPYGTSRSWFSYDGGTVYGAGYKNITAGSGTAVVFVSSTNGLAGYISTTDTTVTYASVSDYRLKQDVKPLSGGLARVNALKPSIYKWKSDGSSAEGFIAHELAEVVPSAVIGSKDEVNEDGSIKAQGVDLSKVVPVLVAAIQELTARVQTLETR